jgi:hypothetical protein
MVEHVPKMAPRRRATPGNSSSIDGELTGYLMGFGSD